MYPSQASVLPDLRPSRSPKRFFTSAFSPPKSQPPPLPPIPSFPPLPTSPPTSLSQSWQTHTPNSSFSSTTSNANAGLCLGLGLGYGAQVVRTPSEALREIKQPLTPVAERVVSPSLSREQLRQPLTAPMLKAHPSPGSGESRESRDKMTPLRSQASQANVHNTKASVYGQTSPCQRHSVHKNKASCLSIIRNEAYPSPDTSSHQSISPRQDEYPSPKMYSHQSMSPSSPSNHIRQQRSMGSISSSPYVPFGSIVPYRDRDTCRRSTAVFPSRDDRRLTVRPPPPRMALPPTPFTATLLSKTTRASPTAKSETLITLEFGYSLDDSPRTSRAVIPWPVLIHAGGHVVRFIQEHLEEEGEEDRPDMTDGSSAEESDLESEYGLDALLNEEYLKSLFIASPPPANYLDLLPPPTQQAPITSPMSSSGRKRAVTRNQYAQQEHFPSPSSPFSARSTAPLRLRRHAPALTVNPIEQDGGGVITELKVLLLRDASAYQYIVARLINGLFPRLEGKRRKVEEECLWLGMKSLAEEAEAQKRERTMVSKGGAGYI